jgi:hypothetical protein
MVKGKIKAFKEIKPCRLTAMALLLEQLDTDNWLR